MRHLCCSCCISNYQTIWAQHCNSNSEFAILPVVQGRANRWLCLLGCRGHPWLLLIYLSVLGFSPPSGPSKAPGRFVISGHACVETSDGQSSLYGRPGGYNLISDLNQSLRVRMCLCVCLCVGTTAGDQVLWAVRSLVSRWFAHVARARTILRGLPLRGE